MFCRILRISAFCLQSSVPISVTRKRQLEKKLVAPTELLRKLTEPSEQWWGRRTVYLRWNKREERKTSRHFDKCVKTMCRPAYQFRITKHKKFSVLYKVFTTVYVGSSEKKKETKWTTETKEDLVAMGIESGMLRRHGLQGPGTQNRLTIGLD